MSVTRAALRQAVAARMMRTVVGQADGGSTVALADLDQLQDAGASDDLWTGSWLQITAGANAGAVRRVTAYDPTAGSITVNRPFGRPINATSQYELLRLLSPDELHQAIDDTLARCWHRTLGTLTLIADGGMEDVGTSAWDAVGAAVRKVDGGQSVSAGARALEVTNHAAHGHARSAAVQVSEGQQLTLDAAAAARVGTAELAVHHAAADTVLASTSAVGRGWQTARLRVTVPAGCPAVQVRLGGVEAAAETIWNRVSLATHDQHQFPLPAWVTRRQQVVEVWERRGGPPRGEHLRAVDWWRLMSNPTANGTPFWLEVGQAPRGLLVIEALRPYEALASDASTTDAPRDWVVAGAVAHAYRRLRRDALAADMDGYAALQQEAAHEFQGLSRLYQPRIVRRVQLGERI